MFTPDITLDTDKVYSLVSEKLNSSLRSDSARAVEFPRFMTISHETSKTGKVSSVVIFDSEEVIPCNDSCAIAPMTDQIRAQFKIQYNPKSGRTDIEAELNALWSQLFEFLSDTDNWNRLLNREK